MSTKTSFKRIALVAVAALGFGLLSAAPSSAAVQSDVLTLGATTSTGVIGTAVTNTVSLTFVDTDASAETATATVALLSSPSTSTAIPTVTITTDQGTANALTGATSASGLVLSVASTAAGRTTGAGTISLTAAVAGTYVIRVTPAGGLTTTAQTWTVTVGAKPAITAAATTVHKGYDYYNDAANVAVRGTWAAPDATTDALTLNCYAYPGYGCARIKVVQSNGSTTAPMLAADSVAITATATGPGLVEINGEGNTYSTQPKGTYAVETSGQNTAYGLTKYVYVWSSGVPGAVSVVIKAGDVVLATKTVNFFEAAKTFTAAAGTGFSGSAYPVGASSTAINVTAKDPSGSIVPGATVYAFSSDETIATVATSATTASTGIAAFTLTGVKAGTATISFGNASTLATSTVTTTMAVQVTGSTATTVKLALDKSDYAPGEKMTLTISATDSNGKPVADGSRAVIASPSSNVAVGCTLSASTTLLGGSATQTCYAPATSGSFTISATEGAATASTTKATVSVTATVTNASLDQAQAATDAAAEATDAANAATDAANAAAEAADAATAAAQDASCSSCSIYSGYNYDRCSKEADHSSN